MFRNTVREVLEANGAADNNSFIVIAGLSDAYSHYITTFEEYQYQRYEAASTLFGPNTLAAYQQEYSILALALAQGKPVPPGPTPPDLSGSQFSFQPPVIVDEPPFFGSFGDVQTDVNSNYQRGDTVEVVFWGADPRNGILSANSKVITFVSDYRTQDTFLTVEQSENNQWIVILTDGDFETRFEWERSGIAASLITITWEIPSYAEPGTYRIRTFGTSLDLFGDLTPYTGTSSTFTVS